MGVSRGAVAGSRGPDTPRTGRHDVPAISPSHGTGVVAVLTCSQLVLLLSIVLMLPSTFLSVLRRVGRDSNDILPS